MQEKPARNQKTVFHSFRPCHQENSKKQGRKRGESATGRDERSQHRKQRLPQPSRAYLASGCLVFLPDAVHSVKGSLLDRANGRHDGALIAGARGHEVRIPLAVPVFDPGGPHLFVSEKIERRDVFGPVCPARPQVLGLFWLTHPTQPQLDEENNGEPS